MKKICTAAVLVAALVLPPTASAGGPGAVLQSKGANYTEGTDFTIPSNPVPVGNSAAPVATADDGCEAADFASLSSGAIALVRRGICIFRVKVENAQAAGASGVLIYNNVSGLTGITLAGAEITIPVLFITQELGEEFVSRVNDGGMRAHMLVRRPAE